MVFLFRDRSVVNILLLLLLSVGVHLHPGAQALQPTVAVGQQNGLFSYVLANYIYTLPLAVQVILFHALLVAQALRLNMVMQDLRMFSSVNYVILTLKADNKGEGGIFSLYALFASSNKCI